MKITVRPYLFLRTALGSKEIELNMPEGATLSDLIALLKSRYNLPDQLKSEYGKLVFFEDSNPVGLTILINGSNVRQMQGVEIVLPDNAVVSIFPPSAGG